MVNLILLILLLFGFLIGLKRGFVLQVFHLLGFIGSFIVAILYYKKLASQLALWIPYPDISGDGSWAMFLESVPMETAFYNAIAFIIIFFATKIILQIIASMLDFVSYIPILSSLNKIGGAVLGFLEIYLYLFILLYILALTPVMGIQTRIQDSSIALFIIEHTPFLSEKMKSLWFTDLISLLPF
ncbi:CvpA family protein [Virgibacillus sp. W0181]|uniref:CvpA family protein n=1 Tax=Virgibacillus sp. W0181 TaxID=3391581 RepID=UPI003F46AE12